MNPNYLNDLRHVGACAAHAAPYSPSPAPALSGHTGRRPSSTELQAAADAATALELAQAQRNALADELDRLQALAEAGVSLIAGVRHLRLHGYRSDVLPDFARFRKELQPKANELGCKIVLVGDRTAATLVLL